MLLSDAHNRRIGQRSPLAERAPGPGEVSEWLRYSPPPLSAVPDIPGSLETVLDQLRRGGMVIVCDDPDRENEGDLCVAAQFVTAEVIAFMAREARGLICLSLPADRCHQLDLPRA